MGLGGWAGGSLPKASRSKSPSSSCQNMCKSFTRTRFYHHLYTMCIKFKKDSCRFDLVFYLLSKRREFHVVPRNSRPRKMQRACHFSQAKKSDCGGVSVHQIIPDPLHGIHIYHFILSIARQVAAVACLGLTYLTATKPIFTRLQQRWWPRSHLFWV